MGEELAQIGQTPLYLPVQLLEMAHRPTHKAGLYYRHTVLAALGCAVMVASALGTARGGAPEGAAPPKTTGHRRAGRPGPQWRRTNGLQQGEGVMIEWANEAAKYGRITITGHSLGGAMAQRFYVMASAIAPEKLRLLTYKAAAIDMGTASKVTGKKGPQRKGARSTRVNARGDVVPHLGDSQVPSDKLKYTANKSKGLKSSHT